MILELRREVRAGDRNLQACASKWRWKPRAWRNHWGWRGGAEEKKRENGMLAAMPQWIIQDRVTFSECFSSKLSSILHVIFLLYFHSFIFSLPSLMPLWAYSVSLCKLDKGTALGTWFGHLALCKLENSALALGWGSLMSVQSQVSRSGLDSPPGAGLWGSAQSAPPQLALPAPSNKVYTRRFQTRPIRNTCEYNSSILVI